jgi:hypothetical protein
VDFKVIKNFFNGMPVALIFSMISKLHFRTCLLVYVFFSLAFSTSLAQPLCLDIFAKSYPSRDYISHPPTLKELRENIMAVHATNFIPDSGILSSNNSGQTGVQQFRSTMHFSLGELVKGHDAGNWDDASFAVLIPFAALEPKLLNVYHMDSFIFGEIEIPPGSVILAKQGSPAPQLNGVTVISYDSSQTSLREVVRQTLITMDKWVFESESAQYKGQTLFLGQNVNKPEFFQALTNDGSVTWGMAEHNPLKALNIKITSDFPIYRMKKSSIIGPRIEQKSLVQWILTYEEYTRDFRRAVVQLQKKRLKFSDSLMAIEALHDLRRYLRLIKLEIEIQRATGRSLSADTNDVFELSAEAWSMLLHKPVTEEIVSYFSDKLIKLIGHYTWQEISTARILANDMTPAEVQRFIQKHPVLSREAGIIDTPQDRLFREMYRLSKQLEKAGFFSGGSRPLSAIQQQEVIAKLLSVSKELLMSCSRDRCVQTLERVVNLANVNREAVIQMLQESVVGSHLKLHFDLDRLMELLRADHEVEIKGALLSLDPV